MNCNQLSLPYQDDCKTRKYTKFCISKQGPHRTSTFNRRDNKQYIDKYRIITLELTAA